MTKADGFVEVLVAKLAMRMEADSALMAKGRKIKNDTTLFSLSFAWYDTWHPDMRSDAFGMSMKKKVIYMAVDKSDLELPIAVTDTVSELADIVGVKPNTILAEIARFKSGKIQKNKKQQYFRFEIDEQTT